MYEALLVIFLLISIGLVALIILLQGNAGEAGPSFGGGGSGTLFSSSGSDNFMTRITVILATLFFVISLILGNLNSNKSKKGSEWENLSQPVKSNQTTMPSAPVRPSSDIPH